MDSKKNTISDIALALNTPFIPTRKLIIELLIGIVLREDLRPEGHKQTIAALENLSVQMKEGDSAYGFWFKNMAQTLSGRGKMGSLVGASTEFRKNAGVDSSLNEYAVSLDARRT
jgi:cytokinesis protein